MARIDGQVVPLRYSRCNGSSLIGAISKFKIGESARVAADDVRAMHRSSPDLYTAADHPELLTPGASLDTEIRSLQAIGALTRRNLQFPCPVAPDDDLT